PHAIESYVCVKRSPLSQTYSLAGWRYLEPNFAQVLETPHDLAARGAMQLGAYFAGMAIEASMLGAAHACANPLTAHYGITHGIAIGIMLPHVIRLNAHTVGLLYGDLAHDGGRANGDTHGAAELLARRITELMKLAELPTTLSAC